MREAYALEMVSMLMISLLKKAGNRLGSNAVSGCSDP
jgi:hypothetical protein